MIQREKKVYLNWKKHRKLLQVVPLKQTLNGERRSVSLSWLYVFFFMMEIGILVCVLLALTERLIADWIEIWVSG